MKNETEIIQPRCPDCESYLAEMLYLELKETAYDLTMKCSNCGLIYYWVLDKTQNFTIEPILKIKKNKK